MTNVLLCALFSIFSLQIFTINYKISFFSKAFLNIPLSIFEIATPIDDYKDGNKLYFDKNILEKNVRQYFANNINQMCGNYYLNFFYYSTDDNLFCKTNKCDGVNIILRADIMLGIMYTNKMSYFIKENK